MKPKNKYNYFLCSRKAETGAPCQKNTGLGLALACWVLVLLDGLAGREKGLGGNMPAG